MSFGAITKFIEEETGNSNLFCNKNALFIKITEFLENCTAQTIVNFAKNQDNKLLFSLCIPSENGYLMALGFQDKDISDISNELFHFLTRKGLQSTLYPSSVDAYTLIDHLQKIFGKEKPMTAPKIVQKDQSNTQKTKEQKAPELARKPEKTIAKVEKTGDIFKDDDFDIPSDVEPENNEEAEKIEKINQRVNENPIHQRNQMDIVALHQLADQREHNFQNLIEKWNKIGAINADLGQQHSRIELVDTEYNNYRVLETLTPTAYGIYKSERGRNILKIPVLLQEDLEEISKHPSIFDSV